MREEKIIDHLMDIKERLSMIETNLEAHMLQSTENRRDLEQLKEEMTAARSAIRAIRWVVGLAFVTVPAAAAAFVKILEYVRSQA